MIIYSIEEFLGFDEEEIEKRKRELKSMVSKKGSYYLNQRLREFETPQWRFLKYLLQNNLQNLEDSLGYFFYHSRPDSLRIMEGLRDSYILDRFKNEL